MSFHNVGVDPGLLAQVHVLMFGKTTTDTHVQALRHLHYFFFQKSQTTIFRPVILIYKIFKDKPHGKMSSYSVCCLTNGDRVDQSLFFSVVLGR